ncbi:putative ABC transporter ATP-binding protein [Pelotomaculum schinkii]|uniref:Putative ABC transporter ATP-binding protein n=1 Tax=Pelotomaculum schinkii TaxID=78350 RepID=A0A4Y7RGW6_9FIRM|nr:ABC-F type ribosomal protection protein [Pelotomaculum schinkii]TEB07547.1 putative ABC transporter ATP-binding protein [Pelotomaculum schinkii]
MLLLEANNIKKQYGDRLVFSIDSLKIYQNDRIGVVGINGCGKTTLLNVLTGNEFPGEGTVRRYGGHAYITQLDDPPDRALDRMMGKKFRVPDSEWETMSGGEKTRLKIARGFSAPCSILFADEPTCNLDLDGIRLLEEQLKKFEGALVIVSHDRSLMDALCAKILEIESGKVTEYAGNYSDYKRQKEAEIERRRFDYEQYVREKHRLTAAIIEIKQKSVAMKKTPSRMGNSEARLHRRKTGQKMAKVDRAAAAIEKRIGQLEKKEKPAKPVEVNMYLQEQGRLYCRSVITGQEVSKSFGNKLLFDKICFEVPAGRKVALVGDNGSGKTTLLKMIAAGEKGITLAQNARIGYFRQDLGILDEEKTILENVIKDSVFTQRDVRLMLAQLLFKDEYVHKKVKVLSGGERVKAALAKIFVSGYNIIVLDEPTNYLDIYSLEALEKVMKEYMGAILFVSHDRKFIDEIADQVIVLQKGKALQYAGNYSDYLQYMESKNQQKPEQERIMQLENRLNEVVGRLCVSKQEDVEILNTEYEIILKELKRLRKSGL